MQRVDKWKYRCYTFKYDLFLKKLNLSYFKQDCKLASMLIRYSWGLAVVTSPHMYTLAKQKLMLTIEECTLTALSKIRCRTKSTNYAVGEQ